MARKIAAREMSRVRHDKVVANTDRRLASKKQRHAFNLQAKPFDDAVARIDFEITELDKEYGKPEGPKRKKAKKESSKKSSKKSSNKTDKKAIKKSAKVRSSKRARSAPAKYREISSESEEDESYGETESEFDEGDEGDDDDSLSSLNERLSRLEDPINDLPQVPRASRLMSAPVRANS